MKRQLSGAYERELAKVKDVYKTYLPGEKLVEGGQPLTQADLDLLRLEHRQLTKNMQFSHWMGHFLADFGMYIALYALCGVFIYYRQPSLLRDSRKFTLLLGLVVVTVVISKWVSPNWRAEIVPMLLFSMTATIVYRQEIALLLSSSVALLVVLSLGEGLVEFVIIVATAAAAIQLLDRVRSRTKLIYVGLWAGAVAALTTIGVSTVASQAFGAQVVYSLTGVEGSQSFWDSSAWSLITTALWYGSYAVFAGVLMTGLLPFIEKLFDVQTDISLLELGDAAHPLLQQLVRRAAGTYNHSINVASIAEAAADSIGGQWATVPSRCLFPRHRQNAQTWLLCGKPRPEPRPARFTGTRDEHSGDYRACQGWCRPGSAAPSAPVDYRFHRTTSRHNSGGVLLQSSHQTERSRPQRRRNRRNQFSLSGTQASDQRDGGDDAGRRRGKRLPRTCGACAGTNRSHRA